MPDQYAYATSRDFDSTDYWVDDDESSSRPLRTSAALIERHITPEDVRQEYLAPRRRPERKHPKDEE